MFLDNLIKDFALICNCNILNYKGVGIMTNSELLMAISDMLDQKLEEKLEQKLEEKLDKKLDEKLDKKLAPINEKLDRIEQKVDVLEQRVDVLEKDVGELKQKVDVIEKDVGELKQKVGVIEKDVRKLELIYENDLQPRLQNIESCYLSTYRRYQDSIMENDAMKLDIQVLKRVVMEHSEKLQKIS